MQQRLFLEQETCPLRLSVPFAVGEARQHSARATIPSSGWIATRLVNLVNIVCVAGSLGRRMARQRIISKGP